MFYFNCYAYYYLCVNNLTGRGSLHYLNLNIQLNNLNNYRIDNIIKQ
jgi:hypothetical protein